VLKPSLKVKARHGLSLLEVLAALAIFLLALIGLGQLVIMGGERARDVQDTARATQLAQSKLAEVAAGIVPLGSQSGNFDEDPDWTWSLEASQNQIPNLWDVSIQVSRKKTDGAEVACTLYQEVLDPAARGSAYDAELTAQANAANSSSSSSSSSSGSTSSSSSPQASAGASKASAGATKGATMGTTKGRGTTTSGRGGTNRGGTGGGTRGGTPGPGTRGGTGTGTGRGGPGSSPGQGNTSRGGTRGP
jgi:Tfp pilus assembly protein PilV